MTEQNFSTVRLVAAILLALGTTQAVWAQDAVTCPVEAMESMQADEIRQLLPTGDAFKDAGALAAAVAQLQSGG